jgi:uncharacterized protein YggE
MENLTKEKSNLMKMGGVLFIILSLYFITKIVTEIKSYNFIGGAAPASNTISFEGKGEISTKPDLATISFTIRESNKDLKTAQDKVTAKEAAVLAFLDNQKIEKKDIKTENYNSYPKYEYQNRICPVMPMDSGSAVSNSAYYCPPGKNVLTGYEVSEYLTVKVRDITKAGDVLKGVGVIGVSEMSGPNFSTENEDKIKAQARKLAIDDAKAKAEALSHDLGVKLVRIVNFSESGNYPMMYATSAMMDREKAGAASPSPVLPTGENKITSNVVITYEIR